MRSIINISLPEKMAEAVEESMQKGHFSTKSEFFRMLVRLWIEGKFVSELEDSQKELRAKKGKLLKSLKDLR